MLQFLAPVAGAALAGGGSLLGQLLANEANAEMAREQMAFQERMSGTAYQRATADMRLAGLNPALAYMQGGASSPGGASAQMEDVIGPAVSSAMQAMRLKKELRLMDQQLDLTKAQTEKTQQESMVVQQERQVPPGEDRNNWQRRRDAEIAAVRAGAALDQAQLPAARVKGSPMGGYLDLVLRAIGGANDVRTLVAPKVKFPFRRR